MRLRISFDSGLTWLVTSVNLSGEMIPSTMLLAGLCFVFDNHASQVIVVKVTFVTGRDDNGGADTREALKVTGVK